MTGLRILEISNVQLYGNIKSLSNLLALLNWPGYPSKCLPSNFRSRYLHELHLHRSSIVQIWDGKKDFENLKVIDVSDSEYLLETPDFSKVPNLERLVLRNCRRLHHIHPSINSLCHLIFLDLNECSSLKRFSSKLTCKNLKYLILSKSGVTSSPEFEGNMEHLSELYLDGTPIKQLHSSIEHLVGLMLLDLKNCMMLSSLPNEIGNLKSLQGLFLGGCVNLDEIPPSLGNAQCLQYLEIYETSICRVPPTIHCLKNLKLLNCDGLSCSIWHSLLPPCNIIGSDLGISGSRFGLESLECLSLRGCNLVEEDFPEDLHYFSSLKTLDLSGNNFVRLPDSINHLKNIRELRLHDCFKLQNLPKLPNLVPIASCSELLRSPALSLPIPYHHDKHFVLELIPKAKLKLDLKAFEDSISKGDLFSSTDDMAEVLECFNEIREGNVIDIERYQFINDANNIYGVVLSACIECSQDTAHEVITFYCNFFVELGMEEGNPEPGILSSISKLTSRSRFWMLFIPLNILPKCRLRFKIVVKMPLPSVNVQKCGVSVLSHQNAPQFLANMFNKAYRTRNQNKFCPAIRDCNDGSKCSCDEPETIDQYCSTQYVENECDSFLLLKRSLKSILQRTYEEEKGRSLHYFFPQGPVLSWFRIQQPKDRVAVKLPLNLFKEKKWMGLAVFAIFSVPGNSDLVHHHTFNFRISSNDDGRHLIKGGSYSSGSFLIPLSFLQSSPQILFVTFKPRHIFPYAQSEQLDHFYVSFISIPTRLRVESCGARLVFQHNVEGLISTIMDCVLKSGQELYQNYSQIILRDVLTTYHRPIQIRVPAYQPTTSTSSDLSGQHESFRHLLFMECTQDLYKSKLDAIIHGKEIPDFFSSRSTGNKGTVRTPERLYFAKCEVGVLVCAVVVINKQTEKLEHVKVLDLKCEFGVDSHEMEPEHHLFVPAEKILSIFESSFIWLSCVPITEFNVPWMCCDYLKCKVSTSHEELFHVQHCGLHLLYASERKMLDNLLI